MGFGDKLKDLRKQAQEAVAEHRDQIEGAVGAVGVAANAKTRGKHTQRIAKFGEKATNALDKFADKDEGAAEGEGVAEGQGAAEGESVAEARKPEAAAPVAEASQAPEPTVAAAEPEPTVPAAEPEAPVSPPSAAPAQPSSGQPPASNPDLAAWAAGDDGASQ
jgi:hypothetical protein